MRFLLAGAFHGDTRTVTRTGNVTLTHVDYRSGGPGAGWHYHEHAFLTLVLRGHVADTTRRGSIDCAPGTVLYQPAQEPHRSTGSGGKFESFFVELEGGWFDDVGQSQDTLQSARHVRDPRVGILLHELYRESRAALPNAELVTHGVLTRIVGLLEGETSPPRASRRLSSRIRDVLHASNGRLTLVEVARELDVHPVYLSRYFTRHFRCGFREYLRLIRVETSLALMHDSSRSLSDIAFSAGFADQSHFVRCFRKIHGQTPSQYRRIPG